jgi:putative MATE family efflux protein
MADTGVPEKQESIFYKDWTQGPIVRNLLLLSWPMVLMETLFVVSQVVDMIWVGKLGTSAIAAMGVAFIIVMLIMSLDFGLIMGARAMVARYVGAGDVRMANHIAAQALILGTSWGLLMTVLGIMLAKPFMGLFGLEPTVIADGVAYIRITFAGWLTMDAMVFILYIVQASGDAIRPMVIESLTRIIHISLCPFLVLGLWIFPRMGVGGAALAGVIGQAVGAVLAIGLLFGGGTRLHVTRKDFQLDLNIIVRILKIGFPALITNFQRSFGSLVITWLIAPFGTAAMAAHSLFARIENFITLPGFGLGMGAGVLVGQNLGAGQPERAEKSGWMASWILEGFMIIFSAVVLLWADGIISIFTADPSLIKLGATFLKIGSAGFIVLAFSSGPQGSISGAGDTVPNLIIGFITCWVVQIPLALLFSRVDGLGVLGIRWALVIGITVQTVIYIVYFRLGKWKTKKV